MDKETTVTNGETFTLDVEELEAKVTPIRYFVYEGLDES